MSDPQQVAQRLDAAFNAKDADARPWSADAEFSFPGGRMQGREQIRDFERAFWEAFPDVQLRIQRMISNGPMVAGEGMLTGTHTGVLRTPQGEVPPTGQRIDLPYARILQVDGDEAVSEHIYYDQLQFLGQLGLVPGSR